MTYLIRNRIFCGSGCLHVVTFARELDRNVRVNSGAILSLSSILKRKLVQSQNVTLQLHRHSVGKLHDVKLVLFIPSRLQDSTLENWKG
jgi:hypothetical protein